MKNSAGEDESPRYIKNEDMEVMVVVLIVVHLILCLFLKGIWKVCGVGSVEMGGKLPRGSW